MEERHLQLYQREIERQCRYVSIASHDLDKAIETPDTYRIWYSIQSILIAAGNISKLLWPPRPLVLNRGEELRQSLSVRSDSCLEARRFRDHFEHFDERLDKRTTSKHAMFIDANVGPPGMIGGVDPGDYVRHFDPATYTLHFIGEMYELRPVLEEITELWREVTTALSKKS